MTCNVVHSGIVWLNIRGFRCHTVKCCMFQISYGILCQVSYGILYVLSILWLNLVCFRYHMVSCMFLLSCGMLYVSCIIWYVVCFRYHSSRALLQW